MHRPHPSRTSLALLTLIALAALPVTPALAQGRPSNEASFRSRFISRSDLGGGATVSQSSLGFSVEAPFPVTGGVNGKLAVGLDWFDLDFGGFNLTPLGGASPVSRGKMATVSPSVSFRLSDEVMAFAGPQWELSAARGAATGRSTQWSGTAGAIWRYRPGLTLVGGLVISERLGYSTQFLPIAGFSWQIDEAWSLALTGNAADYQAPVLKLTRSLGDTVRVFGQVGLERGYVRLAPGSSIPDGYLRYKAIVPQLGVEWRLSPQVEVTAFTGAQLSQDYDFKDRTRQYVYRASADGAWVGGLRATARF